MSVGRESKDPGATESFGFNYINDLASGDTISTSVWAFETMEGVATSALTEVAKSNTTTTTAIQVSGGVLGATYWLKNTIVTTNGDTIVRRMMLDIEKE